MPDMDNSERKETDKREFMREKIIKQPVSKRQIAKRFGAFLCLSVLFGAISAVSFVLAKPLAERYLENDPSEHAPIIFTKDEPESEPAESSETLPSESETSEEEFKEAVSEAMSEYAFSVDTLTSVYSSLSEVAQQADKGIVTVRAGKQDVDLFGNPVENTGDYAGVIIAKTSEEYLVFTYADAVRQADSIAVTFYNGTEVVGETRQIDEVLDMALVAVKISSLSSDLSKQVQTVVLGNSYSVNAGDFVIGAGGPAGVLHSITYGTIAHVAKNVRMVDGVARILYADLHSNSRMGTFLLNTSGEVIGWTSDVYKTDDSQLVTTAVGISDYKAILEKMINGQPVPYFGVTGQEVNSSMWNAGIPSGVYVKESVVGSPAYEAGIQNGDIITRIGEKDIGTFKEFQNQVEHTQVGTGVSVIIMRKGRDGYTELEYQLNVRSR